MKIVIDSPNLQTFLKLESFTKFKDQVEEMFYRLFD